ncbi:MAG: hypothetical protein ACKVS5_08275 [Parvularculaceae bacterium]
MRAILISAASAVMLSGLTAESANAQSFDASKFVPPSSLAKSVAAYCERTTAPKVALVEYVDGYLATCGSYLSTCLRPLTQGYGFIEIELSPDEFVINALPPGFYRAEIIDAPSVQCRAFDAATLGERPDSNFNNLKSRQKCVKFEKVDAPKSKYKYVLEFEPFEAVPDIADSTAQFERIVRLSDDAIVAERVGSSIKISDDVSITCRSPGRRAGLPTTVIPPSAFAPLP